MKQYDTIIFVDSDDTARAVMAATIMRSADLVTEPRILSRGLVVLFPQPVNPKAEAILRSHDMTAAEHTASQLSEDDLTQKTLVLVMEENQKPKAEELLNYRTDVYSISEFTGFSGDIDPLFGEDLAQYGRCWELLRELVRIAAKRINEEEQN
ncbi:MAG: hypothetical protein ACOYBC_01970 [Bilifractor sp.]